MGVYIISLSDSQLIEEVTKVIMMPTVFSPSLQSKRHVLRS